MTDESLSALMQMAALFSVEAGAEYKMQHPESWARIVSLFEEGKLQCRVSIGIQPATDIRLIFFDGEREHVTFTAKVRGSDATIN